jgi:hypothetical protein
MGILKADTPLSPHHKPDDFILERHGSGDASIARNGASKNLRHGTTYVHTGMSESQIAGAARGGIAQPTSTAAPPDASSANPLDPEPKAKNFAPVATTPGMVRQTNGDIGSIPRSVLDTAKPPVRKPS